MESLYDRFAALCAEKGEKPAVVCKKAGVAASLPTELKMGRKKGISLNTAGKLASYLGVPVQKLLGQDDTQTCDPNSPAFVKSYCLLDQIDKAKVEAFIAGLLAQEKYNNGGMNNG